MELSIYDLGELSSILINAYSTLFEWFNTNVLGDVNILQLMIGSAVGVFLGWCVVKWVVP